jgi:hypothetical protein
MAAGLNDAGRGLNIAIVNPRNKEVVRVGHFDTFNSGLSIFITILAQSLGTIPDNRLHDAFGVRAS